MKTLDRDALLKDGAKLIAESKTHALFLFSGKSQDGWRRLALHLERVPKQYRERRSWWLSYTGKCLVTTRDCRHLLKRFPAVHDWVLAELSKLPADQHPSVAASPKVEESSDGWCVIVGSETVAAGLTNAEAWRIVDRHTDIDLGMEQTRKRIQTATA